MAFGRRIVSTDRAPFDLSDREGEGRSRQHVKGSRIERAGGRKRVRHCPGLLLSGSARCGLRLLAAQLLNGRQMFEPIERKATAPYTLFHLEPVLDREKSILPRLQRVKTPFEGIRLRWRCCAERDFLQSKMSGCLDHES